MLRKFTGLSLFGLCLVVPARGSAQTAALLAAADATQLAEVQLAKVMAEDSSLWLSVRLHGRTRLALVVAETAVEPAPAADAWLRALDFATRVRIAAPSGPFSGCGALTQFELADSGRPEAGRVAALEVSSASSELELRRLLADRGLNVDVDHVAQFASETPPPFQVLIYDVPASGGSTEALRLLDRGHPNELPKIINSGANSLPLSLIALAKEGVLPLGHESADPSELPVSYRAWGTSSDYLLARADWFVRNPTGWLNEVQTSAALFAWTVFPSNGQIAPVVSHYFEELSGAPEGSCEVRVRAAHARGSLNALDFVCDGADDLANSLAQVGFTELRLSRFFGSVSPHGSAFRVAPSLPRSPLLFATELDKSGCPAQVSAPPNVESDAADPRTAPPVSTSPVVVSAADDPNYQPTPAGPPVSRCEGRCSVDGFDSASNGSCNGDSSSSDSSAESCSGDSSSSDSSVGDSCSGESSSGDSSGDSCSGDSSSDDSGPDSCNGDASGSSSDGCSGDSSDSSDDSAGCGKSEYDGDTCSRNSADGNSARSRSAALWPSRQTRPRPRNVRLSLLTLLAAALALPLRRLRSSR